MRRWAVLLTLVVLVCGRADAEYFKVTASSIIAKGPWVDVRAFMDGVGGKPTLSAWESAQTTTDVTSVLQAAIDNQFQGGIVFLPPGTYLFSSTLVFSKPIQFRGAGTPSIHVQDPYASTKLLKAASLNGDAIRLTDRGTKLSGFWLDGQVGNGGDGIVIWGAEEGVEDVGVSHMGRDGIRVGTDDNTQSANTWYLNRVWAHSNTRHGFYVHDNAIIGSDGVPNTNAGTGIHLTARANGGDGFRVGYAVANTWIGLTSEVNVGSGVTLDNGARSQTFIGGDFAEVNGSFDFAITAGASNNRLWGVHLSNAHFIDYGTGNIIVGEDLNRLGGASMTSLSLGGGTPIIGHLTATDNVDFDLTTNQCQGVPIAVIGAASGDTASIGVPSSAVVDNIVYYPFVTTNQVSIYACRVSAVGVNPPSGLFRVDVWKH